MKRMLLIAALLFCACEESAENAGNGLCDLEQCIEGCEGQGYLTGNCAEFACSCTPDSSRPLPETCVITETACLDDKEIAVCSGAGTWELRASCLDGMKCLNLINLGTDGGARNVAWCVAN